MRNKKQDVTIGYSNLVDAIGKLLKEARRKVARSINNVLVSTYWDVGKYIVEYEQGGNERAEYGARLLERLAHDLTETHGLGFSKSNLLYMRKFYLAFPKGETVSHLLSWSHYFEILKHDDPLEISFYVKQCENERWSVRELKRQMNFYLNYFRKEVMTEGDNPPIGIVLGANADRLTMELAMDGIPNNLFVSRYQLYLPNRELLEQRLRLVIEAHKEK